MQKDKEENTKPTEHKEDQTTPGVSVEKMLLKGPMPDLSKMKLHDLREECQMWRNVWGWVPSEVKYYVARVGQQVGITMRNYKRYLGMLLDTHWILDEIELGVYDKFYDAVDGQTYFERKVVKTRIGGIMDLQWIKERVEEQALLAEGASPTSPETADIAEEQKSDS